MKKNGRIVSSRRKSEVSLWFGKKKKKAYLSFVNWEKIEIWLKTLGKQIAVDKR